MLAAPVPEAFEEEHPQIENTLKMPQVSTPYIPATIVTVIAFMKSSNAPLLFGSF